MHEGNDALSVIVYIYSCAIFSSIKSSTAQYQGQRKSNMETPKAGSYRETDRQPIIHIENERFLTTKPRSTKRQHSPGCKKHNKNVLEVQRHVHTCIRWCYTVQCRGVTCKASLTG